jgi:hypothetical protein
MSDKPVEHEVDAHLPSDSEEFENKVVEMQPKLSPEQQKFEAEMNEVVARITKFVEFSMANENVNLVDGRTEPGKKYNLGRDALLLQLYVQSELNYATLTALATYVIKDLNIPDGKIMADTKVILEKNLFDRQQQYGILITPNGVTQITNEGN